MDPDELANKKGPLGQNRTKEKQYAFDYAFDKNTGQIDIFQHTTKNLVEGILHGYNATVFAYGATGAGKTYTMVGTENNPGTMYLTLQDLFQKVSNNLKENQYNIRVSFLEIYNEQIRDLIDMSPDMLELREDPEKGVQVAGLSEIEVESPEDVMELLFFGNQNRTQEATGANETSSRSHAVLQITVEEKDKVEGIQTEINIGKLSLIDLAGSERASRTNNRGIRMVEGANINRSLLALGNCINALVDELKHGKKIHIPYRDSKLTRLLKDSLGGNCRTVMIANISPSDLSYEDTNNTLKYANRAKNIKTQATKNVLTVDYHISKYTQIIKNLQNEINDLKKGSVGLQLPTIKEDMNQTIGTSKLEIFQKELSAHFDEETRIKRHIHEIDQKIIVLKMQRHRETKDYVSLLAKFGSKSEECDSKSVEMEKTEQSLKNFEVKLNNYKQMDSNLLMKREEFSQNWER